MREIKFRAWDKVRKIMGTIGVLYWNQDMTIDRVDFYYPVDVDGLQDVLCTITPAQDIEIMQFTGLYDKNGKEIYEGDIVKRIAKRSCCGAVEYTIEGVVEWFCEGWVVRENGADIGGCAWANQKNEIIEVIGNIYENPELIEEKK